MVETQQQKNIGSMITLVQRVDLTGAHAVTPLYVYRLLKKLLGFR